MIKYILILSNQRINIGFDIYNLRCKNQDHFDKILSLTIFF